MSMLDTVGGLSGGLGSSGGVGGSIPSNSSAASSAATATIQPTITLGTTGGGYNAYGPFSVNFPGVNVGQSSDINSPPVTTSIGLKGMLPILLAVGGLVVLLFIAKR